MAEISGAKGFVSKLRTGAIVGAAATAVVLAPSFAANAQQATKVATGGKYGPSAIELRDAKRITADTDCKTFKFSRAEDAADTAVCEYFRGQALQRENAALRSDIKALKSNTACAKAIDAALDGKNPPQITDKMLEEYTGKMCALAQKLRISGLKPQDLARLQP